MAQESKLFTAAEVAKHSSDGDAWVIISDKVYDISKFAKVHPGGRGIIMKYAGKDATEAFKEYHNSSILPKFARLCIGSLSPDECAQARPIHVHPSQFGDMVPYGDPAWYQRFPTSPFYKQTHIEWRAKVRAIVETHMMPHLTDLYANKYAIPPLEISRALGASGILATMCGQPYPAHAPCPPPKDYDYFHEFISHDEVARVGVIPATAAYSNGPAIALSAVNAFGTDALRALCNPPVLAGEVFIALAISEPNAGSDVAGVKCSAVRVEDPAAEGGGYYVVNGNKKWITNGTYAKWFVTAVRTSDDRHKGLTFVLIDADWPGISVRKVNIRASDISGTAYIDFDNVRVPFSRVIGNEGDGFKLIMHNFNHERWYIAILALRASRVILENCIKWATRRRTFGVPIHKHQAVRLKIASMARQVESTHAWLEALTYQMCVLPHEEAMLRLGDVICLLKAHSSKVFESVAGLATHVMGGMALDSTGVGRAVEFAAGAVRGYQVPGGTEDIMEDFAARQAFRAAEMFAKL